MGILLLNVLFHIKTLIHHANTVIPHGVVYATYRVLMAYGTCLLKPMGTLPLNDLFHNVWTDIPPSLLFIPHRVHGLFHISWGGLFHILLAYSTGLGEDGFIPQSSILIPHESMDYVE